MVNINDYAGLTPAWCAGCGNFGILNAFKKAMVGLNLEPDRILLVSGIGQAGKLPHYTRGNVFNSLHGRPIPVAVAAKMVNHELIVIAVSGDGDAYGEGGNHFLHAVRRNHDITYLVHDNQVYALTKGQASPTSEPGYVTRTTLEGAPSPVNPLALAIVTGAGFVARSFAGDLEHLAEMIKRGIRHRGFALIDILQPCVTFNRVNTFDWYRQRVYKLDETKYNTGDKVAAISKAMEWGERIPIGVIFEQARPTFEDQLPAIKQRPLVNQPQQPAGVEKLLSEFL
ncbi:MAG: 2-oxoacid:ferredoxin oxidoreductase subunit beta [Dehalococcoidales bacterium]|nr:2-oxoacid:ferredoxin oxidoreductase subunit beta [Dehalococcoidales bacterium]